MPEPTAETAPKPTPQEFIENWPLYTRANMFNFSAPGSISRMCETCEKETTWLKADDFSNGVNNIRPAVTLNVAGYSCGLCRKQSLTVIYELFDHREILSATRARITPSKITGYWAVRKVGQIPPPAIDVPADLAKRLGSTAQYYKNALICRGQNYGIAAVAYMRRVVEEKTDELIDVVVELAETHNADEPTITALKKAKEQIRYEDKLKVASELVPAGLRPGGINPLGQLYIHLSAGVHDKTDDECIAVFDDLKEDFEYVFRNLHVEAEQRRDFAKRVQSRAGKGVSRQ